MKNFFFYILAFNLIFSCQEEKNLEKLSQVEKKNQPLKIEKLFSKKKIDSSQSVDTLQISKNFVLGKFNYKKDRRFVKVKKIHSTKPVYLQKEVYASFIRMYEAAEKDGIHLKIVSGTRSFYQQKMIWERKWKKYAALSPLKRAKKILEFSSMPSTSRHHWGTDIDLNNLNNSYFIKGKGKNEYKWLQSNAAKYGFYQVYTSKNNGRKGYNTEKWHWTYLALSCKYLDYYNRNVRYADIKGFKGASLAREIGVIENYVNGISPEIIHCNN